MTARAQLEPDHIIDPPMRQVLTSASVTGITKPLGVPSSAFEAGKLAKPVRIRRSIAPVPVDVIVRKGVALPPSANERRRQDPYGDILRRMELGDMVELEEAQARSMRSRAKKLGIDVTARKLANGKVGIWRWGAEA